MFGLSGMITWPLCRHIPRGRGHAGSEFYYELRAEVVVIGREFLTRSLRRMWSRDGYLMGT